MASKSTWKLPGVSLPQLTPETCVIPNISSHGTPGGSPINPRVPGNPMRETLLYGIKFWEQVPWAFACISGWSDGCRPSRPTSSGPCSSKVARSEICEKNHQTSLVKLKFQSTVGISNPYVSGFQMVISRSDVKWSGFGMALKTGPKLSGFWMVDHSPFRPSKCPDF